MDWFGIATASAFILGAFAYVEKRLTQKTISTLAEWLQSLHVPPTAPQWPKIVITIFDGLFRTRLLGSLPLPALIPSAVASFMAVVALTIAWYRGQTEFFDSLASDPTINSRLLHLYEIMYYWAMGIWIVVGLSLNVLIDYVSLLESRIVLGIANRTRNAIGRTACVVLDAALTVFIALIGFLIIGVVAAHLIYVHSLTPEGHHMYVVPMSMGEQVATFFDFIHHPTNVPVSRIFIYSTFLTSIWLWIFLIVGLAVRVSCKLERVHRLYIQIFNVRKYPLTIIGGAAAAVFLTAYGGWTLLSWAFL